MDAQCARAWDDLLREKEWVGSPDVRQYMHFDRMNPREQKAFLQSVRDAKAAINAELEKRGMRLRTSQDPADRRQQLAAYPEEDIDPLHNMRILPIIEQAIEMGWALSIWYAAKFHLPKEHIFHAHYLRVYNNRMYVYGRYEREEDNKDLPFQTLPIDRIERAEPLRDIAYKPSNAEYYNEQLRYVVGASPNFKYPQPMHVVIRTHSPYMHNLMLSKPLHWTLREGQPCSSEQPGELTMDVQNTIELRSWLIHYGAELEVVEPKRLRNRIRREITAFCQRYDISITDTEE